MDTPNKDQEPVNATPQPPAEAGPIRAYGWEWGREEDRRPRLPWIGIFLIVYGVLLLVTRVAPQFVIGSNLAVLAAGLASLIAWLLRRGTFALYAGAFLTAAAVPGLVAALNYNLGPGFGTLCYGVAFLFIALVRTSRRGGIGWQAVIGILLVALGGSELAVPDATSFVLPVLLVVAGLVLLTRPRS